MYPKIEKYLNDLFTGTTKDALGYCIPEVKKNYNKKTLNLLENIFLENKTLHQVRKFLSSFDFKEEDLLLFLANVEDRSDNHCIKSFSLGKTTENFSNNYKIALSLFQRL